MQSPALVLKEDSTRSDQLLLETPIFCGLDERLIAILPAQASTVQLSFDSQERCKDSIIAKGSSAEQQAETRACSMSGTLWAKEQ